MKIKQFIYSYTLGIDATITGILEASRKNSVQTLIKKEIKKNYQDLEYQKAIQSLQVVEA